MNSSGFLSPDDFKSFSDLLTTNFEKSNDESDDELDSVQFVNFL